MDMRTPGKMAARRWFYLTFLPSVLSGDRLRAVNYLLLLGEIAGGSPELELLDELGVPRSRIHSVERDSAIYLQQLAGDLDISLYCNTLAEYLAHTLHSNQRLGVLNLDICGSFYRALDNDEDGRQPMTDLLLFARRNPRTLIATYHSAGRDRKTLQEGLKSLAFFLWLDLGPTEAAVAHLYARYQATGLSAEVSWNMVLRHLFWFRSQLEHTLLSAQAFKRATTKQVERLFDEEDAVWEAVMANGQTPLELGQLIEIVSSLPRPKKWQLVLDLEFDTLQLLTYAAFNHFYQCSYNAVHARLVEGVTPRQWLERALLALIQRPLVFVGEDGAFSVIDTRSKTRLPQNHMIWRQKELGRHLRRLSALPLSPDLGHRPAELYASDKDIETEMKELVRRLAATGHNSDSIIAQLPNGCLSRASVTAIIANVSRRQAS